MEKLFTKTAITALLIFIFFKTNAQTFPYILVSEMETYTEIAESVELTSVGDEWDDPEYIVPIGFDFKFYGETHDKIYFAGLGGILSFHNATLQDTIDLLIPYIDDIIDIENGDASMQSTISYLTEEVAGQRIFKIQWKDVGFFNEIDSLGTINNTVSFQLWLYETSNNIEFRYGVSNIATPATLHDYGENPVFGVIDDFILNDNGNYDFWYLSGNSTDPSVSLADTTTFNNGNFVPLSTHPADGQVYRFIDLASSTTTPAAQNFPIKVYPNVVSDKFFVEISEEVLGKNTQLFLVNNLGQKVWGKTFTNLQEEINISNFPKGIYYVVVVNENGQTTKKIFKN